MASGVEFVMNGAIHQINRVSTIPFYILEEVLPTKKDIPPYHIAVGDPIEIKWKRFDDELIEIIEKLKWWNKRIEEIIVKKRKIKNMLKRN